MKKFGCFSLLFVLFAVWLSFVCWLPSEPEKCKLSPIRRHSDTLFISKTKSGYLFINVNAPANTKTSIYMNGTELVSTGKVHSEATSFSFSFDNANRIKDGAILYAKHCMPNGVCFRSNEVCKP